MTRTTELAGHLRATDDPLVFEGTAVPYGALTVTPVPEFGVLRRSPPCSFARSAEFWMSRGDGTRMS
jgi:hypothetical protein